MALGRAVCRGDTINCCDAHLASALGHNPNASRRLVCQLWPAPDKPSHGLLPAMCQLRTYCTATNDAQSCNDLLDHLVGALLELHRHIKAKRLGGLHIDHQLELDRGLDGKLARLRALEDVIGIGRRASKIIDEVISVRQQAAEFSVRIGTER